MGTQKKKNRDDNNSKNNGMDLHKLLTVSYFIVVYHKKLRKTTLNKIICIKCLVHAQYIVGIKMQIYD